MTRDAPLPGFAHYQSRQKIDYTNADKLFTISDNIARDSCPASMKPLSGELICERQQRSANLQNRLSA